MRPPIYIGGLKRCTDAKANPYPELWREKFGVSYEIKQKRNGVLDAVSAQDISNRGRKVINPFIGVIPSQEELEAEVEQLYASM